MQVIVVIVRIVRIVWVIVSLVAHVGKRARPTAHIARPEIVKYVIRKKINIC